MNEAQIEALEKHFPLGCVIVFRRPKKHELEEGEPLGVYMVNPDGNVVLPFVAEAIGKLFDDLSNEDDFGDVDDDAEDFGLFDT